MTSSQAAHGINISLLQVELTAAVLIMTDGYKISLLKVGKVYDRATVKGLKKNLPINADGTIDGIYVQSVSDIFGRVFFDDMNLLEDNVTVEGEWRDLGAVGKLQQ